ncbi:WYL domain-containing protein [Coprobacillaceae bacterium CR2/5/TPMF4]|nr:WYL domain-containing protein [Coprobacillaceae bacterium CR2/5/TPMF4]
MITNHEIVINYINSSGQKSNRVVWPYKLFFKSGTWYLLAYCLNKKKIVFLDCLEFLNWRLQIKLLLIKILI